MDKDIIKHGETYGVSVTAEDINEDEIVMDNTWSVAMAVSARIGGPPLIVPPIAIVDGKAQVSIDTGDEPWKPGRYVYDVRLTDPDGHDRWTDPTVLILEPRNSPQS